MNSLLDLATISSGLGPWPAFALDVTLRATLALTLAAVACAALRRRSASVRHLVWASAMIGALGMPVLMRALPAWRVPILPAAVAEADRFPAARVEAVRLPPAEPATRVSAIERRADPEPLARVTTLAVPSSPPAPGFSAPSWALCTAAAWGIGAIGLLIPMLVGQARLLRLERGVPRLIDGLCIDEVERLRSWLRLARHVRLLRGEDAASPMTWGVVRPKILLPAGAADWPRERLHAVLLHELAHVRRYDCLTQGLAELARAVYWFHPLAWLAVHRMRIERERACDDLVLRSGSAAADYAGHLLDVARTLRSACRLAAAGVPMARSSQIEGRLRAILDGSRSRRGLTRRGACLVLAAVAALIFPLSLAQLGARPVVDGEGQEETVKTTGEPRPARTIVTGRVLDRDGRPLEGAEVAVLVSRLASRSPQGQLTTAEVLGRGPSDAQGRYKIEVADEPATSEDRLVVVATAPGSGFAARTVSDLAGLDGEPIRLGAEQPVEVRLVDLEGSAVAGAEVRLRQVSPSTGADEWLSEDLLSRDLLPALAGAQATDAAGRFTLRGIGPDHWMALQVRAAGFGNQRVQFQTRADVRAATITLGRAHIVEGRVTLGDGGPPAVGAQVHARSMSEKHGIGQGLGVGEASTDDDGRYRIEAAPGGSICLEVRPPSEGADAYLMRGHLLVPGESITSRVDFALPRGVLVRGRVIEAGTGRPVAGAVVTHVPHERNNPYFVKSNASWFNGGEKKASTAADGTFRLGVMPGPGYLVARGPTADYLHEEISAVELEGQILWPNTRHYPDALKKLAPKPDEGPVDVELILRRGATVRGHLVGPEGEPVRDAVLFARWSLTRSFTSINEITINHSPPVSPVRGSRFELRGCDPGSTAPVFFLDARNRRGAVVELSGKQAGRDLVVKLEPCGAATVRLVDDRGKPLRLSGRVAHMEVVLTPGASFADIFPRPANETMQSPLMADAIMAANLDRESYNDLKTDQEGRMTLPTLIPGATYRIFVYNQPVKTQIEFTVKPGEVRDLGDLVIRNVDQAG